MATEKSRGPTLYATVRDRIRRFGMAYRTEQAYLGWIRRYVRANGNRNPREYGAVEIERFLTHLAVERHCSVSTQNQALSALLFLYRQVLTVELPWHESIEAQSETGVGSTSFRPRNVGWILAAVKFAGTTCTKVSCRRR